MKLTEQTGTSNLALVAPVSLSGPRVSLNIRSATKAKLKANRLPGQSYDGFLQMLLSSWDRDRSAPYKTSDTVLALRR